MSRKICFVALGAYPLLMRRDEKFGGGPEVQQTLLARELIKHDYEVSFITYDEGEAEPSVMDINGIRVIKVYKRKDVHKIHLLSKVTYLWKALDRADADIYYHCSGAAGIVSIYCRLKRKKFVCRISSDSYVSKMIDWSERLEKLNTDRFGYWLDIQLADVIVVQSRFQKLMLERNFRKSSVIIKPHFLMSREVFVKKEPPIVLWVGAMASVKQPELFLKLAQRMPKDIFLMIGGLGKDQRLYNSLKKKSRVIPNLDFLGHVSFYAINKYFKEAALLVNTSKFEGWPIAFVQAWMHYTPVVSYHVDPDGVICKYKLGFHSETFERLIQHIRQLLRDKQFREELGKNARRYVEREHNMHNVIPKYLKVFTSI
jgi:glycosyltransferase involved in cell wall biosynthesis